MGEQVFKMLDGSHYVRHDFGGHVHVVSASDHSPQHHTYPTGYDSRCSWCWLNAAHSEAAHLAYVR